MSNKPQPLFLSKQFNGDVKLLNKMFGELLKYAGIKTALSYFFVAFQNDIHFSRISCVALNLKTNLLIPIYSVGEKGEVDFYNYYVSADIPDYRKKLHFCDADNVEHDIVYVIIDEYLKEQFYPNQRNKLLQNLSIELFTVNNYRFQLNFTSEQVNPFEESDVSFLVQCMQSFSSIFYNKLFLKDQQILTQLPFDFTEPSAIDLIKQCSGLFEVQQQIEQVAFTNSTVLIVGETGVGKELVARAIHQYSKRRSENFIAVNCGAIPETLIDSELFGHEKGAFTGAVSTKQGFFEQANGGTVFLDEIGELPHSVQVRLLRVLERHEIQRIGGMHVIKLNIRVVAATNKNLMELVEEKLFREDLLYRLTTFSILVPPLRERRADISVLAKYFVQLHSLTNDIPFAPLFPDEEMTKLYAQNWLGNVRQLSQCIERAIIRLQHKKISNSIAFVENDFYPLPPNLFSFKQKTVKSEEILPTDFVAGKQNRKIETLEDINKKHIIYVMKKTKGKINGKNGAAEILDVNPNTLRSKLLKYGFDSTQFKNS